MRLHLTTLIHSTLNRGNVMRFAMVVFASLFLAGCGNSGNSEYSYVRTALTGQKQASAETTPKKAAEPAIARQARAEQDGQSAPVSPVGVLASEANETKPTKQMRRTPVRVNSKVVVINDRVPIIGAGGRFLGVGLTLTVVEFNKGRVRFRQSNDGNLVSPGWVDLEDIIEIQDAIAYFTNRIKSNSEDAIAYHGRGIVLRDRGEFKSALKDLDRAVSLSPNDSQILNSHGFMLGKLGKHKEAIQDYTQSLKWDSTQSITYNNRGVSFFKIGNLDEAMNDWNRAISLDGENYFAFNNRGEGWSAKRMYQRALDDYAEALRIFPGFLLCLATRAGTYYQMGKLPEAIDSCKQAIAFDENYALAHEVLGGCYFTSSDYDNAVKSLSRSIELDDSRKEVRAMRGTVYMNTGKPKLALADAKRCMALAPEWHFGYRIAARILASSNDSEIRDGRKALHYAKKACQLTGSTDPESVIALAGAYAELGNFENAIRVLEELAAKSPGNIRAICDDFLASLRNGDPIRLSSNSSDEAAAMKKASVDGKYQKLLYKLNEPGAKVEFGEFKDIGHVDFSIAFYGKDWARRLPHGHYVYVYPNWYLWEEQDPDVMAAVDPELVRSFFLWMRNSRQRNQQPSPRSSPDPRSQLRDFELQLNRGGL